MVKSLEDISQLTIDTGKGVLDAIVKEAKKNGIPFTRRRLAELGSQVCARLDRDKLRHDCIVQPGQVIPMYTPTKPTLPTGERSESGVLAGVGGVIKITDKYGKVRYKHASPDGGSKDFKQS